jgi:hypothetical protein
MGEPAGSGPRLPASQIPRRCHLRRRGELVKERSLSYVQGTPSHKWNHLRQRLSDWTRTTRGVPGHEASTPLVSPWSSARGLQSPLKAPNSLAPGPGAGKCRSVACAVLQHPHGSSFVCSAYAALHVGSVVRCASCRGCVLHFGLGWSPASSAGQEQSNRNADANHRLDTQTAASPRAPYEGHPR